MSTHDVDWLEFAMECRRINHDLRSPLSVVQTYSELLMDGSLGALAEDQLEAVKAVARCVEQMCELVNELSAHAREAIPVGQ